MERIHSINPERIAWCCAEQGTTPDELAHELGIAESSIEKVMTDGEGVTFNQLHKIADYFGRGVLFFLEKEPIDVAKYRSPQFRTVANQKPDLTPKIKSLIERIEKQRAIYLSICEDLDSDYTPEFIPPSLPNDNLKEAANITRQWLNLSNQNNFDDYRAAVESKGILVFRSNGYAGKWQIAKENPIIGFELFYSESPVIFVKKVKWETKQTFTLFHELAHLLLHKTSSIDEQQDIDSHRGKEKEANAFTGYLLVTDRLLETIKDSEKPTQASQFDEWLVRPRKTAGVSTQTILLRLLELGRLSRDEYRSYEEWWNEQNRSQSQESDGGQRKRYREPVQIFGKPYVGAVLEALSNRQITLAKASSYLDNLKIEYLHQLERHFANI